VTSSLRVIVALALILGFGLESQAGPKKLSELRVAAYKLRREGNYSAAAQAMEQILERLDKKSVHRRTIALELAQLFIVAGKPYRAVVLYRKQRDTVREIATLLSMNDPKRAKEALTIARLERYALGEARAQIQLGDLEAALKILSKGGKRLAAERGKLLLSLKRYKEAQEAFVEASDHLGEAQAMAFLPGQAEQARRRFEDAGNQIKLHLKHDAVPRFKIARKALAEATSGAMRERARLYLAQCYGEVAGDYRKWAQCFAGSRHKSRAIKSATKALQYYKRQRQTLEDGGADVFGREAVKVLGVRAAIDGTQAELTNYQNLPG
jgi:tetratricopeptide (TPR) repeat protein